MFKKIKKQKWLKKQNMLDLIPVRTADFSVNTEQLISLKAKRFSSLKISKIFKKNDYFLVHLDKKGSIVWQYIDGLKNIAQITENLKNEPEFANVELVDELVVYFLSTLYNKKLIDFQESSAK
jgi:hypothetical protein